MYLDTDVVLAELKVDDWLASDVDIDAVDAPKTTVGTGIEVQYVMEDDWDRDRLSTAHAEIADAGIELVPLSTDVMDAAAELRSDYHAVNVFDGVHLGTAMALEEPIVSTDSLFPDIDEVEHVDPRTIS